MGAFLDLGRRSIRLLVIVLRTVVLALRGIVVFLATAAVALLAVWATLLLLCANIPPAQRLLIFAVAAPFALVVAAIAGGIGVILTYRLILLRFFKTRPRNLG
jgi:hypothetical protein